MKGFFARLRGRFAGGVLRLPLVGLVLAVAFAVLVGLSVLGLAKPLNPILYGVAAVFYLLTFMNEVFARQTGLALWGFYVYVAFVGGVGAVLGLVVSLVVLASRVVLPDLMRRCGDVCQPPGDLFWYGLWLMLAGAAIAFALAISEDMETDQSRVLDTADLGVSG